MDHLELIVKAFASGALLYLLVTTWNRCQPGWDSWSGLKQTLVRWGFRIAVLGWSILTVSVVFAETGSTGVLALSWVLGLAASVAFLRGKKKTPDTVRSSASTSAGRVSARQLAQKIKGSRKPSFAPVAQIPLPVELETAHMLMVDAHGKQRPALLSQLVEALRTRGDTVIMTDRDGQLLRKHFDVESDFVFNPFDQRNIGWVPTLELGSEEDAKDLARSMLPDSAGVPLLPEAQVFVASVLECLLAADRLNFKDFLYYVHSASSSELSVLLQDTPLALQLSDERHFQAVRALAARYLSGYDHLQPNKEPFSVTEMVQAEHSGVLFLPYREEHLSNSSRAMACMLDVALRATLSQDESGQRRVWFIVDDLLALGKIHSLSRALSAIGTHGGCVVLCTSALHPLADRDGEPQVDHLLGNTATQLLLAGMSSDTANRLSAAMGLTRTAPARLAFLSKKLRPAETSQGGPLVPVADLESLEPNHAILKMGDQLPLAEVQLEDTAAEFCRAATGIDAYKARNFTAEPLLKVNASSTHSGSRQALGPSPAPVSPGAVKPRPLMSASGSGSPLANQSTGPQKLSGYRKYQDFSTTEPDNIEPEVTSEETANAAPAQPSRLDAVSANAPTAVALGSELNTAPPAAQGSEPADTASAPQPSTAPKDSPPNSPEAVSSSTENEAPSAGTATTSTFAQETSSPEFRGTPGEHAKDAVLPLESPSEQAQVSPPLEVNASELGAPLTTDVGGSTPRAVPGADVRRTPEERPGRGENPQSRRRCAPEGSARAPNDSGRRTVSTSRGGAGRQAPSKDAQTKNNARNGFRKDDLKDLLR